MVTNGQAGSGHQHGVDPGLLRRRRQTANRCHGTLVNLRHDPRQRHRRPSTLQLSNGGTRDQRAKRCDRRTDPWRPVYGVLQRRDRHQRRHHHRHRHREPETTGWPSTIAGIVSNLGTASLIEGYGGVQIGTDGTVTNAGTIEFEPRHRRRRGRLHRWQCQADRRTGRGVHRLHLRRQRRHGCARAGVGRQRGHDGRPWHQRSPISPRWCSTPARSGRLPATIRPVASARSASADSPSATRST